MTEAEPTPRPLERCPDCHGSMIDAFGEHPFCGFKRGPGYGPCGNPRPVPTMAEAVAALVDAAHGDRDGRYIKVPSYDVYGHRRREWDDIRLVHGLAALSRTEASATS